ncbi:hypothetical protein ACQP2P_34480 [Dactylosporangium sp. CA-139114]|uniref:hypothetical protein n=1 Tax=Dactylosporangium sp. CA-139114 TaxID=3239931 RepID=UPI003D9617BA
MPPVKVLLVQWDINTTYATKRATRTEIEEVFAGRPIVRRNLRGRVATHLAFGVTDAGRKLAVAFIYLAETNTAYPITAWEQS